MSHRVLGRILGVVVLTLSLGVAACGTSDTVPPPEVVASPSAPSAPPTPPMTEETAGESPLPTAASSESPVPVPPGMQTAIPRPDGVVDANCAHSKMHFDDNFWVYWLSEGKGVVAFRLYANLDVYDLCNHGGIWGTVAVYDANVRAKNGQVVLGKQYVSYNRSGISGWQNANVFSTRWTDASGWTWYSVYTDNNVGMSNQTYFDYIKVSAYIVFDNVPGSGRRETCTRSSNTWSCKGHLGL